MTQDVNMFYFEEAHIIKCPPPPQASNTPLTTCNKCITARYVTSDVRNAACHVQCTVLFMFNFLQNLFHPPPVALQ